MAKQDYTYDPKFANWNKFYDDLFLEISVIREKGNKALLDFNNNGGYLLSYYSSIVNLFSTHKHYINNADKLENELHKIENILFGAKYLILVKKKQNSPEQHKNIIRGLRKVFTEMCTDFSSNGISVRVEGTKKYNPGEAIQKGMG